jgi:hypothetical protein
MPTERTREVPRSYGEHRAEHWLSMKSVAPYIRRAGILLVHASEMAMRFFLGVRKFSQRSDCILLVSIAQAESSVSLAEGIVVPKGSTILDLYLWHEHLVHCSSPHGLFRLSLCLKRRLLLSLMRLADYASDNRDAAEYQTVRARLSISLDGVHEVFRQFGFFVKNPKRSLSYRLCDRVRCTFASGLLWAFHPSNIRAIKRVPMLTELWMPKSTLVRRYGSGPTQENE